VVFRVFTGDIKTQCLEKCLEKCHWKAAKWKGEWLSVIQSKYYLLTTSWSSNDLKASSGWRSYACKNDCATLLFEHSIGQLGS